MLCVVAIIGLGLFAIYRPVDNEEQYDLTYNTVSTSNFSYIRRQTGQELQDAIENMTGGQGVPQTGEKNPTISKDGVEGAIEFGKKSIGSPYQYGGTGEPFSRESCLAALKVSGGGINAWDKLGSKAEQYKGLPMYDCSGFTMRAYEAVGYNIGRNTSAQMQTGKPIPVDDQKQWKRGDLIFPHSDHVVLYLGNNKIIHAPSAGSLVKEVDIWFGEPVAVRRIIGD